MTGINISIRKPIFGIGINDADYVTKPYVTINGTKKQVMCPYYSKWNSMIMRCYSDKYHIKKPTYIGCTVCNEWLSFMTFRSWMIQQTYLDVDGKILVLDKDLLDKYNKIYSPSTCVFVTQAVNSFMNENDANRNEDGLIGASLCTTNKVWKMQCSDPFTQKPIQITCKSQLEAHELYKKTKYDFAVQLAATQTDARISNAILERYNHYKY